VSADALLTLLATIATLTAAFFAWRTVREAKAGRAEAAAEHADAMRQAAALLDATSSAHTVEMADRARALEQERELQQQTQLNRIGDLLVELSRVALHEELNPDSVPVLPPNNIRWSPIPGLCSRLELVIAIYAALGGQVPAKFTEFASSAKGDNRARIASESLMWITRFEALARGVEIVEPN
jgi:hypothetical protein